MIHPNEQRNVFSIKCFACQANIFDKFRAFVLMVQLKLVFKVNQLFFGLVYYYRWKRDK